MRLLLLGVLVTSLTPLAHADPPRRDRLGGAADISLGGGIRAGEITDHASRGTSDIRLGGGVSHGRVAYLMSGTMGFLFSLDEMQGYSEAPSFFELGIEPSLRYELTRGAGWRVHVRGGWRKRWLFSLTELPRTCDRNGGCDGGFYDDSPTYRASGPVAAIGIGGRMRGRGRGDHWHALGVELAVAQSEIVRPGTNPDLDDLVITLGLNLAFGRGAE